MLFVLTVAGMLTTTEMNDSSVCLAIAAELRKSSKIEAAFCAYGGSEPYIGKKPGDYNVEDDNG